MWYARHTLKDFRPPHPTPLQKGQTYRTDRALPKPDISCATDTIPEIALLGATANARVPQEKRTYGHPVGIRERIKRWLRWDVLSYEERQRRIDKYSPMPHALAQLAGALRLNMRLIALLSLTDKVGAHEYVDVYSKHFRNLRNKPINLLEIGVGGHDWSAGGRSLVLWSAYFRKAKIFAIDIVDKTFLSRGRIKVFTCSQTDELRLNEICSSCGDFDIVIDDGSHVSQHVITSLNILFPRVRAGGLYVVEDLHCSYDESYGGGPIGSQNYDISAMAYLVKMCDAVNIRSSYMPPNQQEATFPSFFLEIESMHFYDGLCVMHKRK